MNTKKFTSTLVALVLALGIVSGFNYVMAGTSPSAIYPNCSNTDDSCMTPINVGGTPQIKLGGLGVDTFLASSGAEFKQGVTVDQLANSVDHTVCVDSSGKLVLCNVPGQVLVSSSYYQGLAVSGIAGYTQSPSPITNSSTSGTHTAFTGYVTVQVTGSNIAPNSQLELTKNSVYVDCIIITGPMTATFASSSYTLSDSINISSLSQNSLSTCH